MANAIVSTMIQLGLVLLVASAVWLAARRPEGFWAFIGLTGAPWRAVAMGAAFGLAVAAALLLIPGMRDLASGRGTVTGEAAAGAIGAGAIAALVLTALVKTALTEEVLFRGLIGRNLIRRWGFAAGNATQAILFGAVHALLLLVPGAQPPMVALLVAATGASGWVSGWLNERRGGSSILPGWAAHATANLAAYLVLAGVVG